MKIENLQLASDLSYDRTKVLTHLDTLKKLKNREEFKVNSEDPFDLKFVGDDAVECIEFLKAFLEKKLAAIDKTVKSL